MSTTARRPRSQQINLVDPSLLKVKERLSGATLMMLVGTGVTLVGLHYAYERYQLERQMAVLAARPADPAAASPAPEALPAVLQAKQDQLAREETLRDALSRGGDLPKNPGALITAVAQALPDKVWLTDLQVLGEKTLVISGGTLDRPALTSFSRKLEASPALHGTPIGVLQLEPRSPGSSGGGMGSGGMGGQGDVGASGELPSAEGATHFAFTLASRANSPTSNLGGASMNPKQWLRATAAQIDAMPQRERVALLGAAVALLVGVEFMVVLPLQTQRQNLVDIAAAAADEESRQKTSAANELARQEEELNQRLKAANEALQAMGVNSGLVGTRGESLSFLLSRTLHDSQVEVVSLRALDSEEMRLSGRAEGEAEATAPADPEAAGANKTMLLYRHRYLLSLSGEFEDVTQAIDVLEEALKPLRIERVRLQGRPDGRVVAAIHWVTIGLDKSWLSL